MLHVGHVFYATFSICLERRPKGVQGGHFLPGCRLDVCVRHTFCGCRSEDLMADLPVLLLLHQTGSNTD